MEEIDPKVKIDAWTTKKVDAPLKKMDEPILETAREPEDLERRVRVVG